MQSFSCTQQVPHLHTKGNVPTFFLREGTFVSIRFSLQSWKAAVWLCQLKSLIKERECQHLLPRELPENVLSCPFWKEGQALFPAPRTVASNCIIQMSPNPA